MAQLYLDLDGVLADFDKRVEELLGRHPKLIPDQVMWPKLAKSPDFYNTLPLMPDAMELWNYSKQFKPIILTGVPRGTWAEPQKRTWVARHFGEDVKVITCLSKEKSRHMSGRGDVLVDDRHHYADLWMGKGGIFIHHTSAVESIAELKMHGF